MRLKPLSESRLTRDGLPPGTLAPPFRLTTLQGGDISLEQYRGRPVLLVFSDPACPPCSELAPRLERVHRANGSAGLQILMVSRGTVADNEAKARASTICFPIALQRHWELSRQYGIFGTPVAYLIDAEGFTAADVASGADPILGLAGPKDVGLTFADQTQTFTASLGFANAPNGG